MSSILVNRNLKNLFQPHLSFLLVSSFCGASARNNANTCSYHSKSVVMDPSSFARPDLAKVTNIFMALDINFTRKVFSGNTDLTVKKIDKNAKEIILDVKELNIDAIYETKLNKKLNFTITEKGSMGAKLTVSLPEEHCDSYIVSVRYETSPNASGLQWLTPEQTSGKKLPYVFSQFQPIHARSVLPCQDTPMVKTTYSAVITAPKDVTVVMSAINDHKKPLLDRTAYHFEQKVPVQSYLIAIAAGALESREIGPRSKVWAESDVVEAAAYEFGETERQLRTAEDLCGPYVWGTYDLLVLPPSFPFGGMENPCLTFVTPTLLAGDRSLANVIAHEIAHSWTGNLVTNANFEHFWLNEGFTMFVERKIIGRLDGKQLQDFQAYGGRLELEETINRMGQNDPLTQLVVDLKGIDPDDAFSVVPYEKGYIFLRYLEHLVGGPDVFEPFLRQYFSAFKHCSITTDDFKKFFINHFEKNPAINSIDWEVWLRKPGMPPVTPEYDRTLRDTCEKFIKTFLSWNGSGEFPIDNATITSLLVEQKINILQLLLKEPSQPIEKLKALETAFGLRDVKNSELKFRWMRIGIRAHWEEKVGPTLDWLNQVGRMKYARPLYRDLYEWEGSRARAVENFQKNKGSMMYVTAYTIAKDLNIKL